MDFLLRFQLFIAFLSFFFVDSMHQDAFLSLFEFSNSHSARLNEWVEVSDTVRTQGRSKAALVPQTGADFKGAIFFYLLHPLPNGAAFAGMEISNPNWDLSHLKNIVLRVRRSGENKHFKLILYHNGLKEPSYTAFYELPTESFEIVTLPFDDFEPYHWGRRVPDAPKLNAANITGLSLQIVGGVYMSYKQQGPGSLEVAWIRAN